MEKLPRLGKAEFTTNVITKELWEEFVQKTSRPISWEEFLKVWECILDVIRQEAIFNPLGVKLPRFIGEIKVQYLPYKFSAYKLDHANPEEKIKMLNLQQRGKVAKIKWERRQAVRFNKILQFYAFDADRKYNGLAKERIDNDGDSVRVSMNTLRGNKVWR